VFVRHLLSHGASWRRVYLQGIDTAEIVETVHARRDDPGQRIAAPLNSLRTRTRSSREALMLLARCHATRRDGSAGTLTWAA
jgi:hypothetical protein